jgi:hypothetical protein
LEDNLRVSPGVIENSIAAHSGMNSLLLSSGGDYPTREFEATQQILTKGLLVKMWVRIPTSTTMSALSGDLKVKLLNESGSVENIHSLQVVARTGEWILCEKLVTDFGAIVQGQAFTPVVAYPAGKTLWIDDLRFQPADAEMSCYVYDKNNLRLLTIFDDQHFGLYYQYNGEGKLIRKMIETERGVKTVQETHYNTKLQD